MNFDHFQILRAIGKGSFGKVSEESEILGLMYYVAMLLAQNLSACTTLVHLLTLRIVDYIAHRSTVC